MRAIAYDVSGVIMTCKSQTLITRDTGVEQKIHLALTPFAFPQVIPEIGVPPRIDTEGSEVTFNVIGDLSGVYE